MKTSTTIFLENLVFYAYHGIFLQERTVGNTFIINLSVKGDFLQAMETDEIEDSISYADIYEVVKKEMDIPSKLLEHVCGRIIKALFQRFPAIEEVRLKLAKTNPPMGADIDSAGVEIFSLRQ